jgi:hypothetical protein
MMKKVWPVLLAVVLVFGLAVLGCGSSGSGDGPDPTNPDTGPKVLFKLKLDDNFQYGDGYQGLISDILKASKNKTGDIPGKITKGDTYAMRIKFTADRPLEDRIQVGLVDTMPIVNYWNPLSYDGDDEETCSFIEQEDVDEATADEPCVVILEFTVLDTASGNEAGANSLMFQTKGDGNKGTGGSGVKGPVTFSFYEFVFIKGTIDDLPEEATPPEVEPPGGSFDIGALPGIALSVNQGATYDDETKVASLTASTNTVFSFSFTDAGYTFNINDTLKVNYACILDAAADDAAAEILPVSIKSGAGNSTDDIAMENYNNGITLAETDSGSFYVDMYRLRAAKQNGLSFQYNAWYGGAGIKATEARVKILSVEKVTPVSPFRVHFVHQTAHGGYSKLAEVTGGVATGGKVTDPADADWLTAFLGESKTLLGWKVLGTDADWTFATSTVTTNLVLYADYTEEEIVIPPVENENFFVLGPFDDDEKTWGINGTDSWENDLTPEIVVAAKYFVALLHTDSLNGAGGLQFHYQGNGNSWSNKAIALTPNWTDIQPLGSYGDVMNFYIVIDLSTLPDWADVAGGTQAKFVLNWPTGWSDSNFTFVQGYFCSQELAKPEVSVDVANAGTTYGWFAKEIPEMDE